MRKIGWPSKLTEMFFKSIITASFSNYAAPFQPIGIVGYAPCAPLFGMITNIEKKRKKVNNFTKIYIDILIEKKPEEKYLLYFLIYLYCCAVFWIEMQIVPELADVNFVRSVVMVFWIQVICMGIFLPIQYRFGYEKTKLLAMLLVVAGPVLMSLANSVAVPATVTQPFSAVSGAMYIVLWVIGGTLWLFSMFISKKIFSKKDLF